MGLDVVSLSIDKGVGRIQAGIEAGRFVVFILLKKNVFMGNTIVMILTILYFISKYILLNDRYIFLFYFNIYFTKCICPIDI